MMKQVLTIILAVVLVGGVAGSVVSGTMAGFFDTERSTQNLMCAGTVNLELGSGLFAVEDAWPCKWYSAEHTLVNSGTLDATASIHITNLVCTEDAPGPYWNKLTDPWTRYPDNATTEPEGVAEEGGVVGEKADGTPVAVDGLGMDICNIADFIDVRIWFDSDDDGVFELIKEGKLSELACTEYTLGIIPGALGVKTRGGGWGSYFDYIIDDPVLELPLMMGQNLAVGTVSVWTAGGFLYVKYDTSSSGWEMAVTHVYVGTEEPEKLAPGSFPYQHDPVAPPLTEDLYQIPLAWSGVVYIAAHAEGTDGETGWSKGAARNVKIEMHFPDIPEGDLGYDYFDETIPAEAKWDHWPTNAYQGDRAAFDIEFWLRADRAHGRK